MERIFILPQGQFTPLSQVSAEGLISAAVNIILIVASVLFVFSLITGGMKYILSGGKDEKVDEAKRQLANAIIGVVIVFSTWASLGLVSQFFGIDLLSFEIPTI
jgi:hypothetical protein